MTKGSMNFLAPSSNFGYAGYPSRRQPVIETNHSENGSPVPSRSSGFRFLIFPSSKRSLFSPPFYFFFYSRRRPLHNMIFSIFPYIFFFLIFTTYFYSYVSSCDVFIYVPSKDIYIFIFLLIARFSYLPSVTQIDFPSLPHNVIFSLMLLLINWPPFSSTS